MKKTIFLTGMPRAMTTLGVNILAQNPRIGGGETSGLLELLYGGRSNYSTSPEFKAALTEDVIHKAFLNYCRHGLNGYASAVTPCEIYVDKSRGWLHYSEFLKEFYPEAKIIVMVRDIRACLSSMEKKWRENPSIADNRDNQAMQNFITVDQRCNQWLDQPPLGLSLKRLYNAIQTKTIENMLVVRAEDLTKNPADTMKKVYDYIEEPYFEVDYTNIKQMTVENDRVQDYGIYGEHDIKPNVQPLKNDYNEVLGNALCANIKSQYNWFFTEFNYY